MDEDTRQDESTRYIDEIDSERVYGETQLTPTPEQHEKLKDGLHGELFADIRRTERRYLVIGHGSGASGKRRTKVCSLLDERENAISFRLEDFGFTGDEIALWAPAFEVLSEMASHIVGVLENYDGGHVWELGFLYRYQTTVRDILWLLKRVYDSPEKMREQYDNGMAASHVAALEAAVGDRVLTWKSPDDLSRVVDAIP